MRHYLYSLAVMLLAATSVGTAQTLKDGYVDWGPSGTEILSTIDTWTSSHKINDDDHFFVTRVKSKARFRNTATQVKTTLTDTNDKRLLCWLPWEDSNVRGFNANALPTGTFDAEIFSMWSYVDHWGNWSAPLGRVPAAMLDVAHKNGVSVSTVAGIPQNSITSTGYATWYNNISEAYGAKAAPMLFYYGSQGLGYNSEFTGNNAGQQRVIAFHKRLIKDLKTLGDPNAENIWYDGTNDNGTNTFDSKLSGYQGLVGTDSEPVFGIFLNYNSMGAYALNTVVSNAASFGRNSVNAAYAGMNMQGGQPSSNWSNLKNYAVSIGLWGAHSSNMFFQNRYVLGTTPEQQQRSYLLSTERWFGGGHRNPVLHTSAYSNTNYSYSNVDSNPGMCSMMSARSTLQWNLGEEPFVTFFNLGNGTFFNWKGVRANNNEWANVGVQDYLPTWRFWFHNNWLGKTTASVPSGIDAQFVWDDAYVGGSCLEISGTTSGTYLHLFKTKFALQSGDEITIRYKLMEGSSNIQLAGCYEGAESTELLSDYIATSSDHFDQDKWVEKKIVIGGTNDGQFTTGGTLAVLALKLTNTQNLKLYLGELSIKRGTSATPAAPNNLTTEVLYNGQTGIDAKMIWDMPGKKTLPTATFNLDVNTSVFKYYAQVDDQEPVLLGMTTSWAALAYRVPTNGSKVRLGVSAVSTDFDSESSITWGDWIDIASQTYTYNDAIQASKTTIKPGQEFTISYVDPRHESATWQIVNSAGTVVKSGSGTSFTSSLTDVGMYTLKVIGNTHVDGSTQTNQTTTYENYIVVSPESTGSEPEIYTLTINGEEPSEDGIEVLINNKATIAYTARQSDGATSKAVDLDAVGKFGFNYPTMKGISASDSKVSDNTSMRFTIAFWMKLLDNKHGAFIKMNDMSTDAWPHNNFCTYFVTDNSDLDATGAARKGCRLNIKGSGTSYVAYAGKSGTYTRPQNRMYFEETEIPVGQWVHVALVFETYSTQMQYYFSKYNATITKRRQSLDTADRYYGVNPVFYLNGVKQKCTRYAVQSEYDHLVASSGEYLCDVQGPDDNSYVYTSTRTSSRTTAGQYWHGFDAVSMPRTSSTILGIGGSDRPGAVNAQIDHVSFWDTALTADQVLTTMNDFTSAPSGLSALYTFDNALNANNTWYPAMGSKSSVPASIYKESGKTSTEGSAVYEAADPTFVGGFPLLSGSAEVKTVATWNIPGADLSAPVNSNTSAKGRTVKAAGDLSGSVEATWPMEGEREITLTLTNDYGTATKTIKAVHVVDPATGIDAVAGEGSDIVVDANANDVLVSLPTEGDYELRLVSTNGRLVGKKEGHYQANTSAVLHLNQPGVYVLEVKRDGKLLPGIKFVKE